MSPAEQPPRAAGERRPGVRGASPPKPSPELEPPSIPPRSQSENLAARAGGNKQANISNNPASCCFHSVGTDMTLNTDADKEVRVKGLLYQKQLPKRMFLRAPVLVQRGTIGSLPWQAAWLWQAPERAPGPAANAWRSRLLRKLGGT